MAESPRCLPVWLAVVAMLAAVTVIVNRAGASDGRENPAQHDPAAADSGRTVEIGQRPILLLDSLQPGPLRRRLAECGSGRFEATDFSIGHRGAPLGFPEHTRESYTAAARQGAGFVECDVTFTRDRELVCRHSQCDLHTTTDILEIPALAASCSQPFRPFDPADIDWLTGRPRPASARCCTSDITLEEFRMLQGRKDVVNPRATTVAEYLSAEAKSASPAVHGADRGTLLTHAESIRLFRNLGVKMIPELKAPLVAMPYEGEFSRQMYAQKMIDEYRQAGIDPENVRPQSFSLEDLDYWIEFEPRFGKQAVFLDSRMYTRAGFEASLADFSRIKRRGINTVAPPMFALLTLDADGRIVPSEYARLAGEAGLDILTWTFERTDLRDGAQASEFYFASIADAVNGDGDRYLVLDALAKKVKIAGIFSDWPATVTYYANCMGLD